MIGFDELRGRLPRALAVVERGAHGINEPEITETIETLSALAEHALAEQFGPPRPGVVQSGAFVNGMPVVVTINHADDGEMIGHIRRALAAGAFLESPHIAAGRRADRAGSPLPASRVPLEDRGRTDPFVGSGINPESAPLDPGFSPPVIQWLPVAIWATKAVGRLVAIKRATLAAAAPVEG